MALPGFSRVCRYEANSGMTGPVTMLSKVTQKAAAHGYQNLRGPDKLPLVIVITTAYSASQLDTSSFTSGTAGSQH